MSRNTGYNVPIEQIIDLIESKGLTHEQAGKLLGISRSAISHRLRRIGYTPERLRNFKHHRADVLAWLQSQIVSYITPAKLKGASLSQLMVALGILYDKERTERNQANTIVESRQFVLNATATMEEARAELAKLKGRKAALVLAGAGRADRGQVDEAQGAENGTDN